MDIAFDVIQFVANNLFNQAAVLIGLIALIGLILQRKPFAEVVGGALRATLGVIVLNIGVEIFVGGLVSVQAIVSSAAGLAPPTADSSLAEFSAGPGTAVPLIIAGGFVVHLVLVRLFRAARYVYLTGHLMYWMAVVIAASIVAAFGDIDVFQIAGAGALIVGCYWVLQPLWIAPLMRKVMGDDSVGLGHTTSTLALATGYGARALKLGDPKKHDAEALRLPAWLAFFKDVNVSTALIIGVLMLVTIAFADPQVVSEQMAGATVAPWIWGLLQGLRFAAGIAILLFGVRMFLAEIVPAFKGLSERALPGTKPALDIPVTFTKAPTSVMLGFLASLVAFLCCMGLFATLGWFVLVPPMIMLFFGGGAGGVFGNAVAGWRGAVFGGVLNGVILAFGQWLSWNLYSTTAPELATLADPDWFAVGWLVMGLGFVFAPLGGWTLWLIAGILVAATVATLTLLGMRHRHDDAAATSDTESAGLTTNPAPSRGGRPTELRVLAVCGAGMGSSLILRTTAERALAELGVPARIDHTDSSSARGMSADVIIAQPTYLTDLGTSAEVMVPITSFVDVDHVRRHIQAGLERRGWL